MQTILVIKTDNVHLLGILDRKLILIGLFSGKLQALEVSSSSKASETVQMIEEINAAKAKSGEDLSLAKLQIETMSKNLTNLETELEALKPLKDQVKEVTKEKQDLEQKISKFEKSINVKETLHQELKNEKQSLEQSLSDLRTKSSDSNAQVDALNADLKAKSDELKVAKEAIGGLKNDLSQLKDAMETMKKKAEENIAIIEEAKSNDENKHIQVLENLKKEQHVLEHQLEKERSNAESEKSKRVQQERDNQGLFFTRAGYPAKF